MRFALPILLLCSPVVGQSVVTLNGRTLAPAGVNVYETTYTQNGRTERAQVRIWDDGQFWSVSGFDSGVSSVAFSKLGRSPLNGSHVLTNPRYVDQTGSWQTVTSYYESMGVWLPWNVGRFVPSGVVNRKALLLTVAP